MSELVAFVFRDQFRAPEVLNELRRRDWAWVRDLDEAVAVTLNEQGKARVHLSLDLSTYDGAGWARLWGSLLSATLFIPSTQVMADAADGFALASARVGNGALETNGPTNETKWWRECLEQSDDFKRDVAALMVPNVSTIFMLLRDSYAPTALRQLRNYGDTILHTTFSSEQDRMMVAILATGKEGPR